MKQGGSAGRRGYGIAFNVTFATFDLIDVLDWRRVYKPINFLEFDAFSVLLSSE